MKWNENSRNTREQKTVLETSTPTSTSRKHQHYQIPARWVFLRYFPDHLTAREVVFPNGMSEVNQQMRGWIHIWRWKILRMQKTVGESLFSLHSPSIHTKLNSCFTYTVTWQLTVFLFHHKCCALKRMYLKQWFNYRTIAFLAFFDTCSAKNVQRH